jgi:leucyl/phenylalanyl-tRNA--protein transferase
VITWLRPSDPPDAFPPVSKALVEPDGLLCAGGDLAPARLLAGYRRGIFPWFSPGQPILWWSPDPRMVLFPKELKVSRSLAKTVRNRGFRITFDTRFAEVAARCASNGMRAFEGTWISPEMHAAYVQLHEQHYAHSVEVWRGDELVGGLYGIALGTIFFGESMFSAERDASKVALYWLVQALLSCHVRLIDCQVATEHLFSLGARLLPRAEFMAHLEAGIKVVRPSPAWPGSSN